MKKYQIILLVAVLATACQNNNEETGKKTETHNSEVSMKHPYDLPDSLSSRRVSFVLNLRKAAAERSWPDFAKKRTEGTLVYFNEGQSEVFFPTPQVKKNLEGYEEYSEDYLVGPRTDSIPFHFEVMISFDSADASQFYYEHPVEQYLSVEETGNYIPSVESTEMWATMAIHEMFHHFQYNTPNFQEYAKTEIGVLPFNSNDLVSLCRENKQFLSLVQSENDMLLKAIAEAKNGSRDSLIFNFLQKRASRIKEYSKKYPYLEKVENYYVIQEGAARYIEYQSMLVLNDIANKANAPKIKNDPKFQSYAEFKEIDFDNDTFNFLVYAGSTTYHYALGFNMMRLLDDLNVDYKGQLLDNPKKALHQYLEGYINTLPNNTFKQ